MKKILFAAAAALLACSCDYDASVTPEVSAIGLYAGTAHIERLAGEQGYGDLSYGEVIDSLTTPSGSALVYILDGEMLIDICADDLEIPDSPITSIDVAMSGVKSRTMGNRIVSWDERGIATTYGDVDIETTYIVSDSLEITLETEDDILCPTGSGYFAFVGGNHRFYVDLTLTDVPGLTDDGAIINIEFNGESTFEYDY